MSTAATPTTDQTGARRRPRPRWTSESVQELGLTTDVTTAGQILGIGRSKAYELAKQGEFPVTILRIGRRYVVPVSAVIKLIQGR